MANTKTATEKNIALQVSGARVHNLKNIDVSIPRNKLVVITGVSGSGKSSLAFDTIYAEGQRRYMESFSAYARQFIGTMERPDVDKIEGLSPVVSIEQKTINKNPRSTVGTLTEIYDLMRLLFARVGEAYSYATGKKMARYTEEQILKDLLKRFQDKQLTILAPVIKGRKGHYRELFEQIRKQGYLKVCIDGNIRDIKQGMKLDRYKVHDIEVVIDRVAATEKNKQRMAESLQTAIKIGKGLIMIMKDEAMHHFSTTLMCPDSGIAYDEPMPNNFSFNSPYGACSHCNGLGTVNEINISAIVSNDKQSINEGGIVPLGKFKDNLLFKQAKSIADKFDFNFDTPIKSIPEKAFNILLYGSGNETVNVRLNMASSDGIKYNLKFEGIVNMVKRHHKESSSEAIRRWANDFMQMQTCPECKGARLRKESLHFKINKKNIAELANLDITRLHQWFDGLEKQLSSKQNLIAKDVLKEIRSRISFLLNVGLSYLTLNRPVRTLSGGESQRIRLATQIGSQLTGVLYILDEPTIGLHQRDAQQLIKVLRELINIGNSIIVVEHDKEIMLASDYILDLGPGAGMHGGEIVAKGDVKDFISQDGLTAKFLRGEAANGIPIIRRKSNNGELILKGARGNNLKNITVKFPLGNFICVTGVSGSGKSTLIDLTLYPILNHHFFHAKKKPMPFDSIEGIKLIDKIIEIDQAPIGRTPRSNPATYIGVFSDIRELFSKVPEAKIRGYKSGRFSFNVKGGRCETCEGAGMRLIEMNFLPNVHVHCEQCLGKRYNRETLEIRYKGCSINDVLNMTVDVAVDFFKEIPNIYRKIKSMQDVGLGYITLGQSSTTLSGGEAQRVKLAAELSKKSTGNTFYILDEPTTGLHYEDVYMLLKVLNGLVDKGNTVLVIEHNIDVVKTADHIIDLGQEGGDKGGELIAEGTPEKVAANKKSYTGQFLKEALLSLKTHHKTLPLQT